MPKVGETLVVIPARGGSKRLPRKNVLPLAGKPLISWTIEAALDAQLDARIIVTSDDTEILSVAENYTRQGVFTHVRPANLATDTASTAEVLLDVIQAECAAGVKPGAIVLLQPTSPLRNSVDIETAMALYRKMRGSGTVVSVSMVDHPTAWVGSVAEDSMFTGIDFSSKRSQDYVQEYRLNGAVYIINADNILSSKSVFSKNIYASIMPSHRSIDIDTEFDLKLCEFIVSQMDVCS